jgi:hypothetical protein
MAGDIPLPKGFYLARSIIRVKKLKYNRACTHDTTLAIPTIESASKMLGVRSVKDVQEIFSKVLVFCFKILTVIRSIYRQILLPLI